MSITAVGNTSNNVYETTYAASVTKKSETSGKSTNGWSSLPIETKSDTDITFTYTCTDTYTNTDTVQSRGEQLKHIADEESTFPAIILVHIQKLVERVEALKEHYSKVNEENKRFPDPYQHIQDKYFNKNSPYYIKGLTQRERQIASYSEERVLRGELPDYNGDDPFFLEKLGGCGNIFMDEMEGNQDARDSLTYVINKEFEKNGIIIPEDAELMMCVSPYGHYISASGVDAELAKRIEEVLNKGKNGDYLWQHISNCNPSEYGVSVPMQYLYATANVSKSSTWYFVYELTGYDLSELENRNGKFYTPDGEDLWQIVQDKYMEKAADNKVSAEKLSQYYQDYKKVAETGWRGGIEDEGLSIIYKNGALYDVGRDDYGYGPGQTAWQDRVREWYKGVQEEKRKEREATLRREERESSSAASPKAFASDEHEVIDAQDNISLKDDENKTLLNYLMSFDEEKLSTLQILINRLLAEGRIIPLTTNILNLHGKQMTIERFDSKA